MRIPAVHLGRITADEREILSVCHKFRCEAFHRGHLRREILQPVCKLLFLTVAALTPKLRAKGFLLPGPNPEREDAEFLARLGITHAISLATDEWLDQVYRALTAGVDLDVNDLCGTLSADLVERIENTIGSLKYVGETEDESKVDYNLQHTQAFEAWKAAGHAIHIDKTEILAPLRRSHFPPQEPGESTG